MITCRKKANHFQIAEVQPRGVAYVNSLSHFSLALPMKVFPKKKCVSQSIACLWIIFRTQPIVTGNYNYENEACLKVWHFRLRHLRSEVTPIGRILRQSKVSPASNKHCIKSVLIRSYSLPYFSASGLNPVNDNSEYADFFYAVKTCSHWKVSILTSP